LSSQGAGASYLAFDTFFGSVGAASPDTYEYTWITATNGVTGYAWWKDGNLFSLQACTPTTVDEAMTCTGVFGATPSGISVTTLTVETSITSPAITASTSFISDGTTLLEGAVTISSFSSGEFVTTTTGGQLQATVAFASGSGSFSVHGGCSDSLTFQWQQMGNMVILEFGPIECTTTSNSGISGTVPGGIPSPLYTHIITIGCNSGVLCQVGYDGSDFVLTYLLVPSISGPGSTPVFSEAFPVGESILTQGITFVYYT